MTGNAGSSASPDTAGWCRLVSPAALAENVPLGLSRGSWEEISVPGYSPGPQENMRVYRNLVSPGYFPLMRIPLLGGRDFTAGDRRETRGQVLRVVQPFDQAREHAFALEVEVDHFLHDEHADAHPAGASANHHAAHIGGKKQ